MKTNYTKGPWVIKHSKKGNKYLISGYTWMNFCKVFSHASNNHKDEAMANAKLIAAAPELLESLLLLNKAAYDGKRLEKARIKAKEAIKKATE